MRAVGGPSFVTLWVTVTVALMGCTGTARQAPTDGAVPSAPIAPRTLVLITREQAGSLAGVLLLPSGFASGTQRRIFNAGLTQADGNDDPRPYLAEVVPQLNTDSWRVFPDGRMETTYRLKPNLTWHDGTPLSAEDFAFAWRVYTTPDFAISSSRPQGLMEQVAAPDARTVSIRWKSPYPDANRLETNFAPLPRHVLAQAYDEQRDVFVSLPFWTVQYVGLGPYKLDRYEPGAFLEAGAFDGHTWGRPKIDRIRVIFSSDQNTALANLLSGDAHMGVDNVIAIQQALILKNEWAPRNGGTVQFQPFFWRDAKVQHRPEFANPPAVLDLRVRKALAHAMDKASINEALFGGVGILADSPIPPGVSYFAELDRSIAKYPFDVRQSEQQMADAGYRKGPDGFYVSSSGERPTFQIKVVASAQNDAERTILADGWQQAGFAMEQESFTPVEATQGRPFNTFRSLFSGSGGIGESRLATYITSAMGRPETSWVGGNWGGWSHPESDRLVAAFTTTLDEKERGQLVIQAAKVFTENLAVLPEYFNPLPLAYPSNLTGIDVKAPRVEVSWNIHEWALN